MLNAQSAQGLAAMFVEILQNETATTKKVLAAMPDAQLDFKLGDKGRTARELMWHIVQSEIWFGNGVANGEFGMEGEAPAPATKNEMLTVYEQAIPGLLDRIKALSGEQLAKTINFFNVLNLPAVMYLNFWNVHSVHHRGQLSTYIRAVNGHVPDIYGGSADEPFHMPASA